MSAEIEKRVDPVAGEGPVAREQATVGGSVGSAGWGSYCEWDEDEDIFLPFDTSNVVVQLAETPDDETHGSA